MPIESQPELTCILHVEDADSGSVAKKLMITDGRKSQKLTNFSSTSLNIIILHLDTTPIVARILLLSPKHYLVIPIQLKNLGANKLGQRADPKEDHHLEFW